MLISFSVKNFMCFKDKVEFDMQPVGSEAKLRKSPLYDSNVHIAKTSNGKELPLLSSSVLYGANASGKSSFLRATQIMRTLITMNYDALTQHDITPFKLDKESATQPSEFEITILAEDNVIYEFGFVTDQEKIHKEWLHAYPKGRIQKLYERALKASSNGKPEYDYQFGPHLHGNKKTWSEATTPHRLFLATAIQLNNTQLIPIYNWFQNTKFIGNFHVSSFEQLTNEKISASFLLHHEESKREAMLKLFSAADTDIVAIEVKHKGEDEKTKQFLSSVLAKQGGDFQNLQTALSQEYEISTIHLNPTGELVKFDLSEESTGTRRLFEYSSLLLHCLEKGATLFVDELDNSLHPLLVQYIIRLFHNKISNPNGAQLIFTTHDTSLLNEDELIRRDQIWFCEKNKKQGSEIYSLSAFKLRKDTYNIEGRYLAGSYGGGPFIPDWIDKEEWQWLAKN